MKKLSVFLAMFLMCGVCQASDMSWDLPGGIGTIGLPFEATEALMGYDLVLRQAVGGASIPVLTLGKGKWEVVGQVGAVGAWPTDAPAVEPYLAIGKDILPYIPFLKQYKSAHVNGFGRYSTSQGAWGSGFSVSYSFN